MAAPAATVRELHARADKQLETIYKAVGSVKDIGYHKFSVQLSRQAYAYEWEPAIMNLAVPALTPAEITDADLLNTADGIKNKLDRRNAFLVILNATDGHPVENLLESMLPGDPRLAFNSLHSYFHPGTIAGLQGAYVNFFTSTMATSGTTIVSWVSHVSRGARIVRKSGGQADETAEVSILLKGLLPEFKQIKTLLNQNRNLTLPLAVSTLMDFARDENILELSKGTNTNKNNVFMAGLSLMKTSPAWVRRSAECTNSSSVRLETGVIASTWVKVGTRRITTEERSRPRRPRPPLLKWMPRLPVISVWMVVTNPSTARL